METLNQLLQWFSRVSSKVNIHKSSCFKPITHILVQKMCKILQKIV